MEGNRRGQCTARQPDAPSDRCREASDRNGEQKIKGDRASPKPETAGRKRRRGHRASSSPIVGAKLFRAVLVTHLKHPTITAQSQETGK